MKLRVLFVIPVFLLAMLATMTPATARWHQAGSALNLAQVLDNDGDTLTDDIDPDDDNDGVADSGDPDPFNANIPGAGVTPTPDPNASNEDSDGDTIPNDLDPDDSNNGVPDNEEPAAPGPPPVPVVVETVPVVADPPAEPEPYVPVTEQDYEPAAPVVTSLPSTGTLAHAEDGNSSLLLLSLVVLMVTIAAQMRYRSAT